MLGSASWPGLLGRDEEDGRLTGVLGAARAGRGQVLVVRGEAGIGTTALLDVLLHRAHGCAVGRAVGVESEREFPFAGLHQLCAPFLDRLPVLPAARQAALGTALGLHAGSPPDRLQVGLAALALFTAVADERPLLLVADDAQWLDPASVQALELVARRLADAPVALVIGVREPDGSAAFRGFEELVVPGLRRPDAERLLASAVAGSLDPRVRDRILAESQGNPLALLELPRTLSPAQLAFGPDAGARPGRPLAQRLARCMRLYAALPGPARLLLLTAAAEPVGDVALLRRAARELGIGADAAHAAEDSGLVALRDQVRFRHPLVRSAVYSAAAPAERREVHRALAVATDGDLEPDRRAWHRGCATVGPDEDVAEDLERSAGHALAHGGLAAAAGFLERAALLTPDPDRRARRAVDAAQVQVDAGAFAAAASLLATAELAPADDARRARTGLLQARLTLATRSSGEALPLLLTAARRLAQVDHDLARDGYLDAFTAVHRAGRLACDGARRVAEAVRAAPAPSVRRPRDLLLDALAVLATDGHAAAAPDLRHAVRALAEAEPTVTGPGRLDGLATGAAMSLRDDAALEVLSSRQLDAARASRALGAMPTALAGRTLVHLVTGDLAAAESLVQELGAVVQLLDSDSDSDSGSATASCARACLAALAGDDARALPLIASALQDATERGEGAGITLLHWAQAVLLNGSGRYADAFRAAQVAASGPPELGAWTWALAELVEAGVRSGHEAAARAAAEELSAMALAGGTEWARGIAAGRQALVHDGRLAEDLHQEAVERLARTAAHVDLSRARLLYGEFLRRAGRRIDARTQLRAAQETFGAMGATAFAERARHELLATGETARRRTVQTTRELTAQESYIARLAAQGLTNAEIGAALYISARTVEWHLRKIFTKLGVTSRRDLRRTRPPGAAPVTSPPTAPSPSPSRVHQATTGRPPAPRRAAVLATPTRG